MTKAGAQDARVVKDMGPAVQVSRPALPAAPTAPAAVNTTNNAGKIAAGGLAAAGAAGLAGYLSTKDKPGQSSNPPAQGSSNAAKPPSNAAKPPPGITPPTSSSLTADEEQELALLANELGKEMGRLPDLDNLLLRHQKLRGEMPQP